MPAPYHAFLSAVAAAAATLIGLLFVAVTVDPDRVRHQNEADRQVMAGMALLAFVDPLFVGLAGLLPGDGDGSTSLVLGVIGLVLTLLVGRSVLVRRLAGKHPSTSLALLALSAAVYLGQAAASQALLASHGGSGAENDLASALIILLVVGIMRSWTLLGMGRGSVAFLHPLVGHTSPVDAAPPRPSEPAPSAPAPADADEEAEAEAAGDAG